MSSSRSCGFSLVELLIALAIVSVMTAVIAVSVSGVRAKGRNAQRSADVSSMLNAVYQYSLDNSNTLPANITTTQTEICKTGAASCAGLIDLSVLTTSQKYLAALPVDPTSTSTNGTGYTIGKNINSRVTVSAPRAEASTTISVIR